MKGLWFGGRPWALVLGFSTIGAVAWTAAPHPEVGRAVVASDHPLASAAGRDVMARGGNAVDGAVAAALSAGVVQPAGSGLGGGGFAVVVDGKDRTVLDFREVAPSGATKDMYRSADGGVDSTASRQGPLAVAVPGESRGLATLVAEHGRARLSTVAAPAISQAHRGFPIGGHLARALERTQYPGVQSLFTVQGRVATPGVSVRNRSLARTLKRWVKTAGEDLYTGAGADAIARATQPGVLTAADLSAYAPKTREPVVATFNGYTLITMPPPSSGGVVLGQVLTVLDGAELKALGHNSSAYIHRVTEAMKHAYADRAHHLGDPDFVDVDVKRLLSAERTGQISSLFDPEKTFGTDYYGPVIAPPRDGGTQHISVVDEQGMAVALTTTINTGFGSGVVVEELGLPLNNEMDDFSAAPGVANAYGLVGNAANAIAPGKRPLSSMTPTVVLDGSGHVVYVVGASGGSTIISGTLQVFLNMAVFDMDPQAAVAAARFHHQWVPDKLMLEPGIPVDVVDNLKARGHTVVIRPGFTAVQAVARVKGGFAGGSDPRKGGWPAVIR
ncbi:MAG: gamma-glutamyltransferase [Myxococcota bacterium]